VGHSTTHKPITQVHSANESKLISGAENLAENVEGESPKSWSTSRASKKLTPQKEADCPDTC